MDRARRERSALRLEMERVRSIVGGEREERSERDRCERQKTTNAHSGDERNRSDQNFIISIDN